jgi:hypothetical protein
VDSSVKVLSIDNIVPTTEKRSRAPPISSAEACFVFTKGVPTAEKAKFIDYLKSEDCQKNIVIKRRLHFDQIKFPRQSYSSEKPSVF